MDQLVSAASRLRRVKEACREFLGRWAIECMKSSLAGLDQLSADVDAAGAGVGQAFCRRPGGEKSSSRRPLILHRPDDPAD